MQIKSPHRINNHRCASSVHLKAEGERAGGFLGWEEKDPGPLCSEADSKHHSARYLPSETRSVKAEQGSEKHLKGPPWHGVIQGGGHPKLLPLA